ncbi:MAG: enoyl-CoA hydratase [Acidimicrobiales bacterium]
MEIDTGAERLLARIEDGVGWIVFNNPARHNAISMSMQQALPPVLERFAASDDVRAVVLRGAGERAFISGADISEFGERRTTIEARQEYDAAAEAVGKAFAAFEKPVVAMIRGICMGGGVLMAIRADIRIASEQSVFAIPAARLGVGYGYPGVAALMDLVGPGQAAEILFTARRLDAAEAARIGLINRAVPEDELEPTVAQIASQIAENAPLTIRTVKAAIRERLRDPDKRDLDRVRQFAEACFRSEDYREGAQAFLEKRRPEFKGR